jgi:ABC-type multidrug transport system fused ATPase/permease subunit
VLKSLFEKNRNTTVMMIAHKLDTAVEFADKILVMDNGEVAEFDTPLSLLVDDE